MSHKLKWIRWGLTLVLGWQLLGWAAPAYADTVYVVQAGDTLYRISLQFGVSVQSLMAANHLANSSLIYAGQQLVIPDPGAAVTPTPAAASTATPAPVAAPTAAVYIVKPGDYLHHIAVMFGASEQAIIVANGLTNANFLMVGQRLVIPSGDVVPTPGPVTATEPTPAPPGGDAASATSVPGNAGSTSTIYIVKAGDTLWGVSRRFGISLAALKSMNQLFNDYVHVGQPLIIPGPGATPPAPPTVEATPPATLPAWVPTISWHARDLYIRSIEHGHNPNAFSVAGDCNSDYAIYLGPLARHVVSLGTADYFYLVNTVSRFWNSINRPSLAVHGGYNVRSVMDPQWANPQQCKPGERPLDCELRVNNSSIVFIALGTGDQFDWRDFEKNYRWLLQSVLDQNVLPVLVTKADTLESQQGGAPQPYYIDEIIRRLGKEYDLPVMDLQLGVQDLPNHGLVFEGGQDFHLSNEGDTRHNIMTLQTLDRIWRRGP